LDILDSAFHSIDVPTLLVHAKDDSLTPLVSAECLRAGLPRALLELTEFGGHEPIVTNDEAFERMVQFLLAEEAMVFADNLLFSEMAVSPWNLPGDKAFMRYYELGCALAEVERARRRLRLIWNWVRDSALEDELQVHDPALKTPRQLDLRKREVGARQESRMDKVRAEEQDMLAALSRVGLVEALSEGDVTPADILLGQMTEMLEQMSAPARLAVEQAGVWWRDTGKAAEGLSEGKYTVDAWGRRRGGSKKTQCAWFRWDMSCLPPEQREGYGLYALAEAEDSEALSCWWCGGAAADHDDLGPMAENEEPGYYPGLGQGRAPYRQRLHNAKRLSEEEEAPEDEALEDGDPE